MQSKKRMASNHDKRVKRMHKLRTKTKKMEESDTKHIDTEEEEKIDLHVTAGFENKKKRNKKKIEEVVGMTGTLPKNGATEEMLLLDDDSFSKLPFNEKGLDEL